MLKILYTLCKLGRVFLLISDLNTNCYLNWRYTKLGYRRSKSRCCRWSSSDTNAHF